MTGPGPRRRPLRGRGRRVITSYSIHYTKLYDDREDDHYRPDGQIGKTEYREQRFRDLNQQPGGRHIRDHNTVDVAAPDFTQ